MTHREMARRGVAASRSPRRAERWAEDELLAAIQEVGTLEGETLGDPSPEVRAMLTGPQPRLLSRFLSL